jgi:phage replication initiation protein
MPSKTNIDWFGFRSKDGPDVICSALQDALEPHMELSFKARKQGWRSFEQSADIWITDTRRNRPETDCQRIGMVMTGGDAVKGWSMASISGDGCAWISDWSKCMDACTEQLANFELKRVDVALDRFDGSHWHDVDAAWCAGEFCPPGGGKKPKARPIDSRRPEDGRTYYVGSRESAKFYRGYEKGMQVLGPQIAAAQLRDPEAFDIVDHIFKQDCRINKDGDTAVLELFELRDWWRDEVEFKPVNQPLPLDLVDNRDQYFAGAFPYLAKVLPMAETQPLITRRERMPQLELAKLLEIIKSQYGNSLFTALHAYHGDLGAVWQRIVGTKHNKALIDAGVLMVDHE